MGSAVLFRPRSPRSLRALSLPNFTRLPSSAPSHLFIPVPTFPQIASKTSRRFIYLVKRTIRCVQRYEGVPCLPLPSIFSRATRKESRLHALRKENPESQVFDQSFARDYRHRNNQFCRLTRRRNNRTSLGHTHTQTHHP